MEREPSDESIEIQIENLIKELFQFFISIHPLFRLIHSNGISPRSVLKTEDVSLPERGRVKLTKWLEKCFERGLIGKSNFRITATMIMGMVKFEIFAFIIVRIKAEPGNG